MCQTDSVSKTESVSVHRFMGGNLINGLKKTDVQLQTEGARHAIDLIACVKVGWRFGCAMIQVNSIQGIKE